MCVCVCVCVCVLHLAVLKVRADSLMNKILTKCDTDFFR